jgi:hypothetical protein
MNPLNLGVQMVCSYFVFSQLDCWVFGWESTTNGGRGFFVLQVFYELLVSKMSDEGAFSEDPKGKSELISMSEKRRREQEAKRHLFLGASGSSNAGNKPSEECKAAMFQALYEWFKETPFTNLNRNYLALGEVVGKEAFMGHMRRLFEDAISGDEWNEDKQKPGYSKWMEDKLVDALYNTQPVLDRYRKLQMVPMNNKELAAFWNKVDNFCSKTKNWSKKSQKSSAHWQQGTTSYFKQHSLSTPTMATRRSLIPRGVWRCLGRNATNWRGHS